MSEEANSEGLPDFTCPPINKLQRILRQLTWRASQGEEKHKTAAWKLLSEGLALLETVRSENTQLRKAYKKISREDPCSKR